MIFVLESRRYLARHPRWALRWPTRLRGMIARRFSPVFDAMVFPSCAGVHSCFMTVPLDLIFVDPAGRVVAVRHHFPPWRWAWGGRAADTVIEVPAGAAVAAGVEVGFHLNLNMNLTAETVEKLAGTVMLNVER